MLSRPLVLFVTFAASAVSAFVPSQSNAFVSTSRRKVGATLKMGADGHVTFGNLDGSDVRVGIIKTRWNKVHVDNLVNGAKKALKECNVSDSNVFVTEVPGAYELPLAARFLALSGTVDAIICAGVLIKGDTLHFEYICEAVSSGIMSVGLQTSTPCIFGVLTCMDEKQVIARSTGDNNHGEGWGKTAVEMGLLRIEALGAAKSKGALNAMGFGPGEPVKESKEDKKKVGFF